jgi:hypothetical protein
MNNLKDKKTVFIPGIGMYTFNRSFEPEILDILRENKLYYLRKPCDLLFNRLNDRELISFRKNLKNKNKIQIENLVIKKLDKFSIEYCKPEPRPNKKRTREEQYKVNERVKQYRKRSEKVSIQISCDLLVKNEFNARRKSQGLTSEEYLRLLLGLPKSKK